MKFLKLLTRDLLIALCGGVAVAAFLAPVIFAAQRSDVWWAPVYAAECVLLFCAGFAWPESRSR